MKEFKNPCRIVKVRITPDGQQMIHAWISYCVIHAGLSFELHVKAFNFDGQDSISVRDCLEIEKGIVH